MKKDYFVAYFDGMCEPTNPKGNLGIGCFILNKERQNIFQYSKYIKAKELDFKTSNNVAEYLALYEILNFFIQNNLRKEKIIVCGDSQMAIRQMTGEYGCNGGLYEPYYRDCLQLLPMFEDIKFQWIPREQNSIADNLSKQEAIKNGCNFRIQKQ